MKTAAETFSLSQITPQTETTDSLSAKDRASLKQSCTDFEAVYLQYMLKAMRKTIPESELVPKPHAEKMYEELLDNEIAQEMAEKQPLGFADQMYRQIQQQLEQTQE